MSKTKTHVTFLQDNAVIIEYDYKYNIMEKKKDIYKATLLSSYTPAECREMIKQRCGIPPSFWYGEDGVVHYRFLLLFRYQGNQHVARWHEHTTELYYRNLSRNSWELYRKKIDTILLNTLDDTPKISRIQLEIAHPHRIMRVDYFIGRDADNLKQIL